MGRAGEHHHYAILILEPLACGGAVGIGQGVGSFDCVSLAQIVVGHFAIEAAEAVGDGVA